MKISWSLFGLTCLLSAQLSYSMDSTVIKGLIEVAGISNDMRSLVDNTKDQRLVYVNSNAGTCALNFVWGQVTEENLKRVNDEMGKIGYMWFVEEKDTEGRKRLLKDEEHIDAGLTPEISYNIAGPQEKRQSLIDLCKQKILKKNPDFYTQFKIKKVTKKNLSKFIKVQQEVFKELPAESLEKVIKNMSLKDESLISYLAYVKNTSEDGTITHVPVGGLSAKVGKNTIYGMNLGVLEMYRKKNIARALFVDLLEKTKLPDTIEEIVGICEAKNIDIYYRLGADVTRGMACYVKNPEQEKTPTQDEETEILLSN